MHQYIPRIDVFVVSLFTLAALFLGCSSGGGGGGSSSECSKDADCKGERVCSKGACVDPGTGGTGGGSGAAGSSGSGGNCAGPGSYCSVNGDCCSAGDHIGPLGQVCISDDSSCHAACSSNSECSSGCCAGVSGSAYGACGAASLCETSCGAPGASCTVTGDCCSSASNAPYGETCLSDDYTCHADCTASSQCNSGCCVKLANVSYGVCGTYASGYTCL